MPSSKSNNKPLGITMGDPAGIGPEVLGKALFKLGKGRIPSLVIGDARILARWKKNWPSNVGILDLANINPHSFKTGHPTPNTARACVEYLDQAIRLLKSHKIRGLVTAPVSKEAVSALGTKFPGHTEYLAQAFCCKSVGMMFVGKKLKTVIATRHIPLKDVTKFLTRELIFDTIVLTYKALQTLFHVKNPHIGLCGLNPHAGEKGTIGTEELTAIIPAIKMAQNKGIRVTGPHSADTLFYHRHSSAFDVIIGMYHDQGLIAIKTLEFADVVNLTIGLPFVRTSPAHGTAFDIAGRNMADPASMIAAINLACRLTA